MFTTIHLSNRAYIVLKLRASRAHYSIEQYLEHIFGMYDYDDTQHLVKVLSNFPSVEEVLAHCLSEVKAEDHNGAH